MMFPMDSYETEQYEKEKAEDEKREVARKLAECEKLAWVGKSARTLAVAAEKNGVEIDALLPMVAALARKVLEELRK